MLYPEVSFYKLCSCYGKICANIKKIIQYPNCIQLCFKAEFQIKICTGISLYHDTAIDSGCTKAENITGIIFTGGSVEEVYIPVVWESFIYLR